MGKTKSFLVVSLVCILSAIAAAQSSTPVETVQQFYAFDRSHSQAFSRRSVNARKRWFSPELARLFGNELRRQDEFLNKNPTDKPYFGDGFPFQPLQETCTVGERHFERSLAYKQDFRQGNRAAVTVTFAYPRPCKGPDPITYTVGLVRIGGVWLIDDLNRGEDHSLKEVLTRRDY